MQQNLNWRQFIDSAEVATAACRQILIAAERAIAERGCFKLVLAGGTTPEQVYRLLAASAADWGKWFIYYGDERCLPADHPERNSQIAQQALLNAVTIPARQIFTIPAELGPQPAALAYREAVSQALPFDLVLLGLGEDGHTASLFPGHIHDQNELTLAVYNSPKPPSERVSLSAKALSDTRELMFLVTGANKRPAVTAWRAGADLPVATITPPVAEIYIDAAAAT